MNKIPLTVEGESRLRVELDELKRVARPRIVAAIAEARAHGDLKENAEYHAARDEQGFTEARIRDLESKLSNAHVIDVSKIPPGDKVIFGSTVTIINVDTDETVTYKIVGDDEANIKEQKISYQSPIVRALIGKEIGDVVVVKTPSGDVEYEIDEVAYQ
ncbi:MAG: transcription elongation factor GreA [Gammaproteobacteria bacterium]|nr:MAG: transcription elongation factor GreA [Gammaproteobacteria bacterium]RLA51574.1 MAG: transcription elongation factor GreA [Gammaproteobacteria bacterium]